MTTMSSHELVSQKCSPSKQYRQRKVSPCKKTKTSAKFVVYYPASTVTWLSRPVGRAIQPNMFPTSSNLAVFVTLISGAPPSPRTILGNQASSSRVQPRKRSDSAGPQTHAHHAQKRTIYPRICNYCRQLRTLVGSKNVQHDASIATQRFIYEVLRSI